ncbi:MAG: hypothetical protein IJC19_08760 [Clostridia bacterium]|nr:hypothetical protein [Clostridia bacterium]
MSIVHESFDLREYNPDEGLAPGDGHALLFGWTVLYGKTYTVDNTWEEEYWDGDGYSTRTHGTFDKYYPTHYVCFDNLKNYAEIQKKRQQLEQIKQKRQTFVDPVITPEQEKLARIRGTYKELNEELWKQKRAVWAANEANWRAVSAEYNEVAKEIFSLVYPTLEWPGEYFVCNSYAPDLKKLNKPFLKGVKKLRKEIEQINGIRAARAFATCDDATLLSLPKPVLNWLTACYQNKKYKDSNFFDEVWNG